MNLVHMLTVRWFFLLVSGYIQCKINGIDMSWFGYTQFRNFQNTHTRLIIVGRTITDLLAGILLSVAVFLMPVSKSISISRLSVFFTPILAYFILNESLLQRQFWTIVGGFGGIIMIMNPEYFNPSSSTQ